MQLNKAKIRPYLQQNNLYDKSPRTSLYTEDYRSEYYNLPIEKLIPFKNQARQFFDNNSIQELSNTIKEHGIRQPLTVIPSKLQDGYFEVVSGERRLRAAKLAELKRVPCIIIHDEQKAEEIAVIENIQRKDLHPIELMQAFKNLLKTGICKSTQELASKIGIAKSTVIEILNLANLSSEDQFMLVENDIKNRDFLRLLCKTIPENREALIKKFANKKINFTNKNNNLNRRRFGIISIMLEGDEMRIIKNKIDTLTEAEKIEFKHVIESLLNELN